jgi:minor extracellular serine protease Vpr
MSASAASAEFAPIRKPAGEAASVPRVRAGSVDFIASRHQGRVTVILRLADPPLAAASRRLSARNGTTKLDVSSVSSRAYLAKLTRAQRAAVAQLRTAVPDARVTRRFQVLLNGITVQLSATSLPKVAKLGFVTTVYPSMRFREALNESPALIGAPQIQQATGAKGDGIKIAVVDDGVDQTNPFFDPTGYRYPAGFPRGGAKWTTPKVIVARTFPGPGAGRPGRLAVDPQASFHGTHVAGIAAGNAGTTAPRGADHPETPGLAGVAPRAYIGNYRVFTVPTPLGNVANTPEIAAAFEAAVRDGMDVINFSGGGAQTDPANDAMFETIRNATLAGTTVVASSGNDRDEFALGSAGSPAAAPEAIAVAATSNVHVYSPSLAVVAAGAPDALKQIPFSAGANRIPPAWGSTPQTLVDVSTIVGRNGVPIAPKLCGAPNDVNGSFNPLPAASLQGAIALVSRGDCTFLSKAGRAADAGAIGIVIGDNRPGEANGIPLQLPIPGAMIADLDATRLRAFLATSGGRTQIRFGTTVDEVRTGRSGVITSFSSAGPTSFGHSLKPDVSAPGGQILSATLPRAGGPFAVFDGTSMSSPHVAGAVALLRQLHPTWSPAQIKSALMVSAGTAYGNTARTEEAPVLLEGAGMVSLPAANDPKLLPDPPSLSFGDIDISRGASFGARLVTLTDANGGGGPWTVAVQAQSATSGVTIEVPGTVEVPPGGSTALPVTIRAAAGAATGENYGFVVLRRGTETRRVPYLALVEHPKLPTYVPKQLQFLQAGDTRDHDSRVAVYRYPSAPFGPPPDYSGQALHEAGGEDVYTIFVKDPVANVGVAVIAMSNGARVDPWFLGSLDENDVQGYAGTPVNVNGLTFGYRSWVGAAGASFPRPGRFYVSVDSGSDDFTGNDLGGQYVLRAWVNDVLPPLVDVLTKRVSAGRPLIAIRALDLQAGVDPASIVIAYRGVLVGAVAYDAPTGIALIPLPQQAPAFKKGKTRVVVVASDYQESKNINTTSEDIMPNTAARPVTVTAVAGPALTWLAPETGECAAPTQRLLVATSAAGAIRSVRFDVDGRKIAVTTRGTAGLYAADWKTKGVKKGKHVLGATVTTKSGAKARAQRSIKLCAR